MTAPTWPRVGDVFIPPQCGWYRVISVKDGVVTLRPEGGRPDVQAPIADFAHDSAKWRHHTPHKPWRHVRTTADFMSESQIADMRNAGRGHLCR